MHIISTVPKSLGEVNVKSASRGKNKTDLPHGILLVMGIFQNYFFLKISFLHYIFYYEEKTDVET